jgi:thiol-disulfide isomerase/thioredoxin
MRTALTLWGAAMVVGLLYAQSLSVIPDEPLARIQVVDEQGQPIRTAKVHVSATVNEIREMATVPAWQPVNARGICVVEGEISHRSRMREILAGKLPVKLECMVAAPGYVPLRFGHTANPRETITATLKPARSFELRLLTADGNPVDLRLREDFYQAHSASPLLIASTDGKPLCASGKQAPEEDRLFGTPPLCLNFGIHTLGDGRYRVDVPPEFSGTLALFVHHPDVIRYYLHMLKPDEWQSGAVEVRLPKPSMMLLEFDLEAWRKAYKDLSGLFLHLAPLNSRELPLMFYSEALWGHPFAGGVVAERNVAPGPYQVSLRLSDKDMHETIVHAPTGGFVYHRVAPKPFDIAEYRGKRQVRVQIRRAGGGALAGAHYRVALRRSYSQARTVQEGRTDKKGAFVLRNLYENPSDSNAYNRIGYQIFVNDRFVRYFTLVRGDGVREISITLAPQPGDPAINFKAVDVRTGKPVELRTLRGKWVYLEFWATWCGPCQRAMEELKAFVEKQPDSWRKQVVVLSVSIDASREVVLPHLQRRGWDKFALHTWDEGQRAAQLYGVDAVPTAFLIDPRGKVVWTGNPLSREQESLLRQIGGKGGAR